VEVLKKEGMVPMWDKDLPVGVRFTEHIKDFIANSHVFLPVLTQHSMNRPWLHQEIGFAAAMDKPIVPVILGNLTVPGFIAETQGIQLRSDLEDAPERLTAGAFHAAMSYVKDCPAIYQCTEDNARRALLLAQCSDSISSLGRYGAVRQLASLTTFHLPDRSPENSVWKEYFVREPNNSFLFENLRKELVALRKHAVECGCRLIVDDVDMLPGVYSRYGKASVHPRINGLLAFLRDDSVRDVVVAVNNDRDRMSSITLVGDWFSSEAVSSGKERVLREALFTRNAHVVRQQIQDFDHLMSDLLNERQWTLKDSRAKAIDYLQQALNKMPARKRLLR
jgi:hypothetical protein